jgi:hypothetical protein
LLNIRQYSDFGGVLELLFKINREIIKKLN